ncbi:MAG TPA: type II secretion system protein GspK, partial [Candidatus Omnitrophota bacterium]|nr:type II secretion system protein GspK [Candidatus Omnitrophota bacterium]
KELILVLGHDEQTAETVSASLIDWKDADDNLSDRSFGGEEDYYQHKKRPYHCKNAPLESLEELLSVRGMNDQLWNDLGPYVTIVPAEGPLKVNFSDASQTVLLALARYFSGARTNTDLSDAQSLVRKVLEYRAGPDGEERTDDDRPVDFKDIVLNAKEKVLASSLLMYEQKRPTFLRMEILAEAEPMRVMTRLNTVIRLSDLSIVSWRRDGE